MKKRFWILAAALLLLAVFFASAAAADDSPQVTLTVNGSSASPQDVVVNGRIRVTVQAPGATGVRVLDPNRWDPQQDYETADCWEYYDQYQNPEYLEVSPTVNQGERQILAEARYDEYGDIRDWNGEGASPWSAISRIIKLNPTGSDDSLQKPIAEQSANSVERGTWLNIRITNPQGKGEWYWGSLHRVFGEDHEEWVDHLDFNAKNMLAVATDRYEAGDYRMTVFAAAPGCPDFKETDLFFRITGAGDDHAVLKVNTSTAVTGEDLFIYARVPGTEHVLLTATRTDNPQWIQTRDWGDEERLEKWSFNEPGTYVLTLYDDGGQTEITSRTVTVALEEGRGKLSGPNLFALPCEVEAGQSFSGAFTFDPNAEWVNVSVEYIPEHGNFIRVYRSDREAGEEGSALISLPAGVIGRTGMYKVNVNTSAVGYEEAGTQTVFFVREAGSGSAPVLTINDSAEDIASWESSRNLRIHVSAPGATAIRLRANENWERTEGWTGGGVTWNEGFGDGDYTFYAQATWDEPIWRADDFDWGSFNWNENVSWSAISNVIKVHVSSEGALGVPTVTLEAGGVALDPENAEVTRGELLTVTVAEQDAEWAWGELNILRIEENNRWMETVSNGNFDGEGQNKMTLKIRTAFFPAGDYYLKVGVDAVNISGNEIIIPLKIAESGENPQPGLDFSRETMYSNQGTMIYGWAPGAERMELEITWDHDPYWRDGRWSGRDSERWDWGCSCGGVYTFTLYYWMPGEDEPQSISETLNVLSEGQLDPTEISGIPALVPLGEDIHGSFTAVEGAEWYYVEIRYSPDGSSGDEMIFGESWNPDYRDLDFSSKLLNRKGSYRLSVSAQAVGIDNGYAEIQFQVLDMSSISEELVIGLSGQLDGENALLHQNIHVEVSAPENVTAVRMKNSTSDWEYRIRERSDRFECDLGVHQSGEVFFMAEATTDGSVMQWASEHDGDLRGFDWDQVSWTLTAMPATVNVIELGPQLNPPTVEFVDGNNSVERGKLLSFDMTPGDDIAGYFGIKVRQYENGRTSEYAPIDFDYSTKITSRISIPTDSLPAGSYALCIDPREYGYHGDEAVFPFTVTEPQNWDDQESRFTWSADEVLTREYVIFSVYAPGAEHLWLCCEDPENVWQEADGDTLVDRVQLSRVNEYHVMAFAIYPGDEDLTKIGETAVIRASAPNGRLEVAVNAPEEVISGEVLTVTLSCNYDGAEGSAACWLSNSTWDEFWLDFAGAVVNTDGTRTETFRISTEGLQLGEYTIGAMLIPDMPGYELAQDESVTVRISDGKNEPGWLTVDRDELLIFEDVQIHVHADGATAIALNNNGMWEFEAGDDMISSSTAWWEGQMGFFAFYTTEEIDPDSDEWQDDSWEGWNGRTNVEFVNILPPSHELDEMAFDIESDTVSRGGKYRLTITSANEGLEVQYGATLQTLEEHNEGSFGSLTGWYGPSSEDGRTIWVDSLEVEPGDYWLHVTANALDCHGVAGGMVVHVADPEEDIQLSCREGTVLTCDMLRIVGYSAGAKRLKLEVSFENGTWKPDPAFFEEEGNTLITEFYTGEAEDTVNLKLTATMADGSTKTLTKQVEVEAPNGELNPSIRLKHAWLTGRSLEFSVDVGTGGAYTGGSQFIVVVREPGSEQLKFYEFMSQNVQTKEYRLPMAEYGLEDGKTYEIFVHGMAVGYAAGNTSLLVSSRQPTVLNLPAGLKEIGTEAFAGTVAEKIIVPAGVTIIGARAFANCPNLVEIELPDGITSFDASAFADSGPVFVYGAANSYLADYAARVDNLVLIPVN